jgi:hypothetical protein
MRAGVVRHMFQKYSSAPLSILRRVWYSLLTIESTVRTGNTSACRHVGQVDPPEGAAEDKSSDAKLQA